MQTKNKRQLTKRQVRKKDALPEPNNTEGNERRGASESEAVVIEFDRQRPILDLILMHAHNNLSVTLEYIFNLVPIYVKRKYILCRYSTVKKLRIHFYVQPHNVY